MDELNIRKCSNNAVCITVFQYSMNLMHKARTLNVGNLEEVLCCMAQVCVTSDGKFQASISRADCDQCKCRLVKHSNLFGEVLVPNRLHFIL